MDRSNEDAADLRFHRPTMAGRPDPKLLLDVIVQTPNAHYRHKPPPRMLAMPALWCDHSRSWKSFALGESGLDVRDLLNNHQAARNMPEPEPLVEQRDPLMQDVHNDEACGCHRDAGVSRGCRTAVAFCCHDAISRGSVR